MQINQSACRKKEAMISCNNFFMKIRITGADVINKSLIIANLHIIILIDIAQHIEVNPKIIMGKPVIKNTRITVELILEKLSAGETEVDILTTHPHLTNEDIKAALAFAAQSLKGENIYPVSV
jgi:uncharacterized protein (DUF433 family)